MAKIESKAQPTPTPKDSAAEALLGTDTLSITTTIPSNIVPAEPKPMGDVLNFSSPDLQAEVRTLRRQTQELLAELKLYKEASSHLGQGSYPASAPAIIVSRPFPPNYVVWLGPEPAGTELCLAARGTIQTIRDGKTYEAVDGNGDGTRKRVSNTTNAGLSGIYIDNGYTSIEFKNRCPQGHKYAGRLWAQIDCPEHAAWLQLTAGRDRDQNPMFAWHLTPQCRAIYDQYRKAGMQRQRVDQMAVDEVVSDGIEMPVESQ